MYSPKVLAASAITLGSLLKAKALLANSAFFSASSLICEASISKTSAKVPARKKQSAVTRRVSFTSECFPHRLVRARI